MTRYLIIFISMGLAQLFLPSYGQYKISGHVRSAVDNSAVRGASIVLLKSGMQYSSGRDGAFELILDTIDTARISYVGYKPYLLPLDPQMATPLDVRLGALDAQLEEVVINTGYYSIPKERSTGSFVHIDNQGLNRIVSGNILERLENIAPGLQFVNSNGTSPADIRVRGLATISSESSPLIVVDGFPYEGDIHSINPNDIESITVLKDASAASIWGARAGNGVIVITSKQGRFNQKASVSVLNTWSVGMKPDLMYDQNRLPSEVVMELEKTKFDFGGFYVESVGQNPLPQYVELLIAHKKGQIDIDELNSRSAVLKNSDIRKEARDHLYRLSSLRQHAVNVKGGGAAVSYSFGAGIDDNAADIRGNNQRRLTLNMQNTFKPAKGLELTAGVWLSSTKARNNGLGLNDLSTGNSNFGLSPYIRLVDENGLPLSVIKDYRSVYKDDMLSAGLQDWSFRPLDEIEIADNISRSSEKRLVANLRYNLLRYFNVSANYQFVDGTAQTESLYAPESYYTRNLVNRFTQSNGNRIIPLNHIRHRQQPQRQSSHSFRGQVNYDQDISPDHQVTGLLGAEIRHMHRFTEPGFILYDYDPEYQTGTTNYDYVTRYPVRPRLTAVIPGQPSTIISYNDRFLSYYGNIAYMFKKRYNLNSSLRWDGSNLFGVGTNQKGTPLWSVGGSWVMTEEPFVGKDILSYLRWRVTYGSAGNVNRSVSAYPVIRYGMDNARNQQFATLLSAGNPFLRWERVNTVNLGVDWSSSTQRIESTIDLYRKYARDLIGSDYLAPSTGIITDGTATNTNLINYANMLSEGVDVQVKTHILTGRFKWNATAMVSYVRNEVTHFNTADVPILSYYFSTPPPTKGKSMDVVYALPWNGLNPESGQMIVYKDGAVTNDFAAYYDSYPIDDLIDAGINVPPVYGSLQNVLQWNNFTISVMISWKTGHVFRRRSSLPGTEFHPQGYHMDYLRRWQGPGDEQITDVPVHRGPSSIQWQEASSYGDSEILVTSGDNIRLQDMSIGYTIPSRFAERIGLRQFRLNAYARNLGILWKANKNGIDPNFLNSPYPVPRVYSLGVQVEL